MLLAASAVRAGDWLNLARSAHLRGLDRSRAAELFAGATGGGREASEVEDERVSGVYHSPVARAPRGMGCMGRSRRCTVKPSCVQRVRSCHCSSARGPPHLRTVWSFTVGSSRDHHARVAMSATPAIAAALAVPTRAALVGGVTSSAGAPQPWVTSSGSAETSTSPAHSETEDMAKSQPAGQDAAVVSAVSVPAC